METKLCCVNLEVGKGLAYLDHAMFGGISEEQKMKLEGGLENQMERPLNPPQEFVSDLISVEETQKDFSGEVTSYANSRR